MRIEAPHWIIEEYCEDFREFWEWTCSSCRYRYISDAEEDPETFGFYHCPWCGTKLIDPDREDEDDNAKS